MSGPRHSVFVLANHLAEGGAERFASLLVAHLPRDRFRPELVLLDDRRGYLVPSDVPTHVLSRETPRMRRFTAWRALRALLARRRPDVLLSTTWPLARLVAAARLGTAGASDTRWVARVAGVLRSRLRDRLVDRRIARAADRVVANSEGLAAHVRTALCLPQGRVTTAPNLLDLQALEAPGPAPSPLRRPLIVAVGRLTSVKRPDLVVEAFSRSRHAGELWWIGDGPLRPKVERDLALRGLQGRVRLLGHLTPPFPALRQADVLIHASDHEGSPNVLIEAQALGIPVVATACPHGPDEIVQPGVTGLLVTPGKAMALTDSLDRVLAELELWRARGHAIASRTRLTFDLVAGVAAWSLCLDQARGGRVVLRRDDDLTSSGSGPTTRGSRPQELR
ncbi:MAG: glycosyltransferase [Planctomycetes bacterium]|nr:glycosyltransferase [Planctomycetota bacterium]